MRDTDGTDEPGADGDGASDGGDGGDGEEDPDVEGFSARRGLSYRFDTEEPG